MSIYYTIRENVITRKTESLIILYDIEVSLIKLLNKTGSFIWLKLDNKLTFNQILDLLIKKYPNAPEADLAKDLRKFINSLIKLNLIVKSDKP